MLNVNVTSLALPVLLAVVVGVYPVIVPVVFGFVTVPSAAILPPFASKFAVVQS